MRQYKKNAQPINACLMKYSMLSFFFQKTRLIFNPFSTSNGVSNNIRIELYLNKTPNKPCLNDGRTNFLISEGRHMKSVYIYRYVKQQNSIAGFNSK